MTSAGRDEVRAAWQTAPFMHSSASQILRAPTPSPAVVHIIDIPDDDVPISFFITEHLTSRRA